MKKTPQSSPYFFDVNGQSPPLPIVVSKRRGARSMTLRYQPVSKSLNLTLPYYVGVRQGLRFIEEKRAWVLEQLQEHPASIPFSCGQVIPVLGAPYRITHTGGRGVVRTEDNLLHVPGEEAFVARRVREWVKKQTRETILSLVQEKAAHLGCAASRLSLRDTRSLWGSCTQDGRLSFSWRIAFAPVEVLDYLVSHEVAHLRELNHSAAFWKLVAELCPHWETSRAWLKKHGHTLYAYG